MVGRPRHHHKYGLPLTEADGRLAARLDTEFLSLVAMVGGLVDPREFGTLQIVTARKLSEWSEVEKLPQAATVGRLMDLHEPETLLPTATERRLMKQQDTGLIALDETFGSLTHLREARLPLNLTDSRLNVRSKVGSLPLTATVRKLTDQREAEACLPTAADPALPAAMVGRPSDLREAGKCLLTAADRALLAATVGRLVGLH